MVQRATRRGRNGRSSLPIAALLATLLALTLLGSSSARADIVWEGKTVSAWPPEAFEEEGEHQLLRAGKKFFPSPRGVIWGLTILVDFSDQAPAFTKPQIEEWLNARNYTTGGLKGSVRDYFFDVSNGAVDFQNEVVGFYRAKKPKSYYEGGSGYARADELWAEVIAALDPEIDFSKFDNDKNGTTDAISLVYAGEGVKWGQGLWPHASGSRIKADGVTLSRYMMSALSRKLTLYTFCHEVGHMLFGWPDLYGFGDYCLMGNASNPVDPAGINDFFRADQGWIPEIEITKDMNVSAVAPATGAGFRYTNPADPGECFFWSNVQRNEGRWRVLRGSGLLFFHYKNSIRVNNPPSPLTLAVVQADGLDQLGKVQWPSPGSDPNDFFFGGGGKTEFSDSTKPSSRWRDGSSSGLRVYDIGPNGSEISFRVGTQAPTNDVPLRPDAGANPGGASDAGVDEPDSKADAGSAAPRDAGVARDAGRAPPDAGDAGAGSPPRGTVDGGKSVTDARVARDARTPSEPEDDESGDGEEPEEDDEELDDEFDGEDEEPGQERPKVGCAAADNSQDEAPSLTALLGALAFAVVSRRSRRRS